MSRHFNEVNTKLKTQIHFLVINEGQFHPAHTAHPGLQQSIHYTFISRRICSLCSATLGPFQPLCRCIRPGWPYTAGSLPMQVSYQTFVARIYPYEKTKNRCPGPREGWGGAEGWDTFPALPECSLTLAQQSSEQLRTHFLGNSNAGLLSQTTASQGLK